MNELALPEIPKIIKDEGEGQALLLLLEQNAVAHIRVSSEALTRGILCLDAIREHALYTYNGYEDWGGYLRDFLDMNGMSSSWAYEYLKVARLAMGGMGLNPQEFLEYGIDRIKPVVGLVRDYNRATGEIKRLVPGVEDKLPSGNSPGKRLGEFIRENLDPETDSATTVKHLLKAELPHESEYGFGWVYNSNGKQVGIRWWVIHPNGEEEGGMSIADMPEHVVRNLARRAAIWT